MSTHKRNYSNTITKYFNKKIKTTNDGNIYSNMENSTNEISSQNEIVDDPTPTLSDLTPDHAAKSLDIDQHQTQISSDISTTEQGTTENVILDIGIVLSSKSTIDDFTKKQLLENHWKPPIGYTFPYSNHTKNGTLGKRFLKQEHLNKYFWLVLSPSAGGVYCIYCSIFHNKTGHGFNNLTPLKSLVVEPLKKFSKLLGKDGYLETHDKNMYHKNAVLNGKDFLNSYNNPELEVVNQISSQRLKQIKENRSRLKPIIESLVFLGRQNIALRGHRDDGSLNDFSDNPLENDGNFRELLKFKILSGDTVLENHIKNSEARATYISKTTQNTLISIIGNVILKNVLDKVHKAKYFSVIFDETTDISKTSQLVIVLRYVYEKNICEDFIKFIDCHQNNYGQSGVNVKPKITGEIIGKSVINILENLSLPLDKCIGITTDGCSVMQSEKCGAVKVLQEQMKFAIKCFCFSHALNLSIMKGCKQQFIRNAFGIMKEVIHFFNSSAKKNFILKNTLNNSLKSLCETRWIEKHDSVIQFSSNLFSIIETLDKISEWNDIEIASKASMLTKSLSSAEFILTLNLVSDIFAITAPISRLLQSKNQDKFSASKFINNVLTILKEKRRNSDANFNLIFNNSKKCLNKLGLDDKINIPRITKQMTNRANPSIKNPEDYFRIVLFIPFLEDLISDLEYRFDEKSVSVFDLDIVLPSTIHNKEVYNNKTKFQIKVDNVITQFRKLIAANLNLSEDSVKKYFEGELQLWHTYWENEKEIPKTALEAFEKCDSEIFPIVHNLFQLLLTLPATSATAERNFSSLRRLKTWMRSRMSEERLNGLALLHCYRNVNINYDDVIDEFAKSNRRNNFVL